MGSMGRLRFTGRNYFARSWTLLTRAKGWPKTVLLLCVASLVPIVGPLFSLGYIVEWARLTAWGVDAYPKQRGIRIGRCIASGWRATFPARRRKPSRPRAVSPEEVTTYELLYFVDPASTEETRAGVMKRIDVAITD
jgi:hypothetical protein